MSQFQLLTKGRFFPLFVTQFLGAFNDNFFKNAVVMLVTFRFVTELDMDAGLLVNFAFALFILPFFLFSASAGLLADKFEKSRTIQWIKIAEILIALLAGIGLYTQNLPLLLTVVFLLGLQSTAFGPLKYGILPQHLAKAELVGGNGLIETGTYVSILVGTIFGGLLYESLWLTPGLLLVAILGWVASRKIPVARASDASIRLDFNVLGQTKHLLKYAWRQKELLYAIHGISWFWFLGSIFLAQIPNYTKLHWMGDSHVVTFLLAIFCIGIGAGCLLCEKLSFGKIELGLVPLGAIGMSVFGIDIYLTSPPVPANDSFSLIGIVGFLNQPGSWRLVLDLLLFSTFGGFFNVPLYALLQHRSDPAYRSRVIAATNIINSMYMVSAALIAMALIASGVSIPGIFLLVAASNLLFTGTLYMRIPELRQQFFSWTLSRWFSNISMESQKELPELEPVLLRAKSLTPLQCIYLQAALTRRIHFLFKSKPKNPEVLIRAGIRHTVLEKTENVNFKTLFSQSSVANSVVCLDFDLEEANFNVMEVSKFSVSFSDQASRTWSLRTQVKISLNSI